MKINYVKFKNFISYGNKWQELSFVNNDNEFCLISGNSASGKSTILNAIVYGLYGKVSGKKLGDLVNRVNGKNMEVEIEVLCGNKLVKIHRGMKPDIFDITINGNSNVGDKAGKISVQDYLEEEIFQLPYHIFTNIVSLSINDFKSFLKMGVKDKRAIIDKIFGLNSINDMHELLKDDIKKVKEKNATYDIKISTIGEQIDSTIKHIEDLSEQLVIKNEDRKNELTEIVKKIREIKKPLQKKLELMDVKKNKVQLKMKKLEKEKNTIKYNITTIEEKVELYNNKKCPTCSSDLTTKFHKHILDKLVEEKKQYEDNVELIKENWKAYYDVSVKLDETISKNYNKLKKLEYQIKQLLTEIKEMESDDGVDEQTEKLQKIVTDNKKLLDDFKVSKTKVEKEFNFLKIVDDILSEKGIKSSAIRTILPNLNLTINTILKKLDMNYKMVFDKNFEPIITTFNQEINVASLSTGEQKRLDFAVLISIIKLIKIKFPFLNLLFLDELFASVDVASVYDIIGILEDLSKKMNLHVFVINHAPIDTALFTHKIKVEKNSGFSTFVKEEYL